MRARTSRSWLAAVGAPGTSRAPRNRQNDGSIGSGRSSREQRGTAAPGRSSRRSWRRRRPRAVGFEGSRTAEAWAGVADRWSSLSHPYRTAYARLRLGEALLSSGRRLEAEGALRGGARGRLARSARGRSSRRSRSSPAEPGWGRLSKGARGARVGYGRPRRDPPSRAGLTARERDVVRLGRRRPHQPRDRRPAVHQREDGQRPRLQRDGQARCAVSLRGRRRRRTPGPALRPPCRSGFDV